MSIKISEEKLNVWADYLLNHSLGGISPTDVVMIKAENICWPLISVLQDKIIQAGATPDINIVSPDNDRGKVWSTSMSAHGSAEQINNVPKWISDRYNNMTKFIEILGASNPELLADKNDNLAQEILKVDAPIKNIRLAKPWVLTLFPTQGFADIEDMTLEEYADVVVSASTLDPKYLEEVEEDIYQLMDKSETITIESHNPNTDKELTLKMNIAGRNIIKCTGKRNFPDGEVFTSPDANTVEGEIYVDLPIFHGGGTIQGIYLKFVDGKITDYSAQLGNETLSKIIETDAGSHRIGEVALGMNNGIKKALKHPLFVEKTGGSLHIAIGASYEECYGNEETTTEEKKKLIEAGIMNVSAQHVDIVLDFREGGCGRSVSLDDKKLSIKNDIWVTN